jgi:hypothetical protein
MRIQIDFSTLGQTKWYQYAVRFLFGGLITALAGIIAKKFGPGIGGLFLAFPAIFPAPTQLHGGNSIRASSVTPKVNPKMYSW